MHTCTCLPPTPTPTPPTHTHTHTLPLPSPTPSISNNNKNIWWGWFWCIILEFFFTGSSSKHRKKWDQEKPTADMPIDVSAIYWFSVNVFSFVGYYIVIHIVWLVQLFRSHPCWVSGLFVLFLVESLCKDWFCCTTCRYKTIKRESCYFLFWGFVCPNSIYSCTQFRYMYKVTYV